ncbi:MAG TPA: ADOP family duplicated permease [Gemmatimonadaceae bacterium]|nr:ADOP family duplicated permease [Gemmatimonadaceae bacterium]
MLPPLDRLALLWRRLRARASREQSAGELDEEMRHHLELLERDFERRGLSAEEARHAARRKFGNPLSLRERSADVWAFAALEAALQDVRYGARQLRRSPAFAAVAVGAIGLAMGVNCALFTLVDAIAWRPLPVADPASLVMLHPVDEHGARHNLFSYPEVSGLGGARALAGVAAHGWRAVAVAPLSGEPRAAPDEPRLASATFVSGSYFPLLGARAALGRTLLATDEGPGAPAAVVLGHRFWETAFASSPAVLGGVVLVNGVRATVVGVAARDFTGTEARSPDVWLPVTLAPAMRVVGGPLDDRANRWLVVHGRLRPGVSTGRAGAELSGVLRAMAGAAPRPGDPRGVVLTPQSSLVPLGPEERELVAPALLAVALVLVIACANLANLLLARAVVRQREIAIRAAVGASRGRLVRQLLTESFLIALLGGGLGLLVADWSLAAAARAVLAQLPAEAGTFVLGLHPSGRVLAYAGLLVLVATLAFGLAPALHATAPGLAGRINGDDGALGTGIRRSRFRGALVAAQVAACVVLLVGSGVLVQSVRRLGDAHAGLEAERVLSVRLGLPGADDRADELSAARQRLAERAARLPGVTASARVARVPFAGTDPMLAVTPDEPGASRRQLKVNVVSAGYFTTVGQRVLRGRAFGEADAASDARVAVVSASAARRLWPSRDAVGRRLRLARPGRGADTLGAEYDVVGVAADARSGRLWDEDEAYIYLPAAPADLSAAEMPLLLRSPAGLGGLDSALRRLARDAAPGVPLQLQPLTELLNEQLLPFRSGAAFASAVGVLGLALAAVGLYGVVAFAVQQQTQEIAVRVALGAQRGSVLALVLRRESRVVLVGLAAGLVLALGEARLLASVVVPLSPLGAGGFAFVLAFLLAVAAAATVTPALKALRVDPMQALRHQ